MGTSGLLDILYNNKLSSNIFFRELGDKMKLVKITIDNEAFYIGVETACKLLTSNYEKPIAINGLEYYMKNSLDAVYRRLAITEYTKFNLELVDNKKIPEK